MAEKMICTSECENCRNGTVDDSDKSKIKIYCAVKNKKYYYGQMVMCDDKEKRKLSQD